MSVCADSSITMTVRWDHRTTYQGPVLDIIEWSVPGLDWGYRNLELEIAGSGSVTWRDLHMNHTGCMLCLPGSESVGHRRVLPRDFWSAPSMDVDCRHHVRVNGEILTVDRDATTQGAWHYELVAPCLVQAQIRIDRAKTMLWAPVV